MRDVLYQVDGVPVPSVTEVLELCGLVDYSRVSPDVLEAASVRGTEVHEWLDLLDHGDDVAPEDIEVVARVEAYKKFRADTGFKPTAIEQAVVNKRYRYAGTPDRVGELNGRLAVVDFKPPGVVQPWWQLQVAGYAACLDGPPERFTLQLRGDGDYRLTEHRDRDDFHTFFAAVRIAHWLRQTRGDR